MSVARVDRIWTLATALAAALRAADKAARPVQAGEVRVNPDGVIDVGATQE